MKVINPSPWVKEPKLEVIELPKEKICISTQDGHQVIIKDEISCLIADSNYTTIHIDGQSILCAQTLSHVLIDSIFYQPLVHRPTNLYP